MLEDDARGAPSVFLGIGQEIVDDLHQPALVGLDPHSGGGRIAVDGDVDRAGGRHCVLNELKQVEYIEVQLGGAHIESGDLQQVLYQVLESVDVLGQQVERGSNPLGQFGPPSVHDLHGSGQRHEGRPQFMAHLRCEPLVSGDPVLEGAHHVVEGVGERGQLSGGPGLQTSAEIALGDGLSGLADAHQWAQQAAAGPKPDSGRRQGHPCARAGQDDSQ